VVVAALAGLLVLAGRGRVRRVEVAGPSMVPTLVPGDRLLVVPPARPLRRGDLVAFRDPQRPERLLVKRVESVTAEGVQVIGDNQGASRDSRDFGQVAHEAVVGVACYRYHPRHRAGALSASRGPVRASADARRPAYGSGSEDALCQVESEASTLRWRAR
jgi:nickel-type superoxide dismutase maturation protease